jgi:predicted porin
VTLYGVADLSYTTGKVDTTKSAGVVSGIASGSRIGLKGTEDLGGGLAANFVMEYAVQPELSTTSMANRQSYAGLSGGFGSLNIGRQYTVIHGVQGAFDPLGNFSGQGWLAGATTTVRADQAIVYTTPTVAGFSAAVEFAAGANKDVAATNGLCSSGDTLDSATAACAAPNVKVASYAAAVKKGDGETTGFALNYAQGALAAKVAYETSKNAKLTYTLPGTTSAATLGGNGTSEDTKRTSIGGSYDFGTAKVSLVNVKAEAGTGELKATSVGVSVPMGALTLGASISNGSTKSATAANQVDLSGNQFGGFYALSKRTTVYALFGNAKIDGGKKNSSSSIGLRHTF